MNQPEPFHCRWVVFIQYRTNNGLVDVNHHIEEIEDLHDIVERGPSWYAIEEIKILPAPYMADENLTVEEVSNQ